MRGDKKIGNHPLILRKELLFRLINFSLITLIFLLFSYQYTHFVAAHYGYMGFEALAMGWSYKLYGGVIFLLSSFFFLVIKSRFIFTVSAVIQLFFMVPNIIFWMNTGSNGVVISLTFILLLVMNFGGFDFKRIRTIPLAISEQALVLTVLSLALLVPLFSAFSIHWNLDLFKFGSAIYDIRKEADLSSHPVVGYIFSPYVKVLIPLLIGFGMVNKKASLSLIGLGLMLIVFLMSPHKSIFFGALVVVLFALLPTHRVQLSALLGAIICLTLTGMFLEGKGVLEVSSLLVRRVFFLPAYLNSCYLEFFAGENLYYSYGFMRHFMDYPFELEPAKLIGQAYFDSAKTNANNGILSDFVINLGYAGAFLGMVIIGLIFKFFDALDIHPKYFGLFFVFIFTLLSSGFTVVMITHGGMLLIVLSYFILSGTKRRTT